MKIKNVESISGSTGEILSTKNCVLDAFGVIAFTWKFNHYWPIQSEDIQWLHF